jgi:hypothetical protein
LVGEVPFAFIGEVPFDFVDEVSLLTDFGFGKGGRPKEDDAGRDVAFSMPL